jgi:hypothetical protein
MFIFQEIMKGIHKEPQSFRIRQRRDKTIAKVNKKKKQIVDLEALIAEENVPIEWEENEDQRLCFLI